MQETIIESTLSPFVKLTQNHLDLMMQYSQPFYLGADLQNRASNPFLPSSATWVQLDQLGVFMQFMQELVKNYNNFMCSLSRDSSTVASPGIINPVVNAQAVIVRAQEAAAPVQVQVPQRTASQQLA